MQLFVWNGSGTTLPNNMNWSYLCAYPARNFPGGEDERAFNTILRGAFGCSFPLNNLPSANSTRGVGLEQREKTASLALSANLHCQQLSRDAGH